MGAAALSIYENGTFPCSDADESPRLSQLTQAMDAVPCQSDSNYACRNPRARGPIKTITSPSSSATEPAFAQTLDVTSNPSSHVIRCSRCLPLRGVQVYVRQCRLLLQKRTSHPDMLGDMSHCSHGGGGGGTNRPFTTSSEGPLISV